MMKSAFQGCCVVSLAALMALVGCTRSERTAQTENTRGTETTQTTETDREQEISRNVTPQDSELGGTEAKRGEEEVQAQQEVVTKRTETLNEKVPTVTTGQEKLDINRMKSEDFVALGLDRRAADQVIQYRDQNGPFRSFEDLSRIPGMNTTWLNKYRDRFAFVDTESDTGMAGQVDND